MAAPVKAAPAPLTATATAALIPFKLADIGEGIAEVEVLKWFVKVRCVYIPTIKREPQLILQYFGTIRLFSYTYLSMYFHTTGG